MRGIVAALFVAVLASVALFQGCVAPFPEGDPRAILNPIIVPWWRISPRPVRESLHQLVIGETLPPNDLQMLEEMFKRQRARRPRFLRGLPF